MTSVFWESVTTVKVVQCVHCFSLRDDCEWMWQIKGPLKVRLVLSHSRTLSALLRLYKPSPPVEFFFCPLTQGQCNCTVMVDWLWPSASTNLSTFLVSQLASLPECLEGEYHKRNASHLNVDVISYIIVTIWIVPVCQIRKAMLVLLFHIYLSTCRIYKRSFRPPNSIFQDLNSFQFFL